MSKREVNRAALGVPFQRMVLRLMLLDPVFARKASTFVEPGWFEGSLKWFFTRIQAYVERHGTSPGAAYLDEELNRHDPSVRKEYRAELESINEIKFSSVTKDEEYVKMNMTDFAKMHLFVNGLKEVADLYNSKRTNEAFMKFHEFEDTFKKITFEDDKVIKIDQWEPIVKKNQQNYAGACFTGLRLIDESLGVEGGGGLLPQTWTTFIGASNTGKSMLSATLAWINAKRGRKVFVTVHEDEEQPTNSRFLAAFSGVPLSRLNIHPDMLSEEEKIALEEGAKLLGEHVRIRYMYGKEATIERVQEVLRDTSREWPFDLYICDYGQCLSSRVFQFRDGKSAYELQGYIYEQLKQICCELNIAGCGGAQANRSANFVNKKGTDFIRTTDVSDCFTIIRKSSNVITINRSDAHTTSERIVFLLDKARQGRCPIAVQCSSDYARARTHYEDGVDNMFVTIDTHKLDARRSIQSQIDVARGPKQEEEAE